MSIYSRSDFAINLYNLRVEKGYTLDGLAVAVNKAKGTNLTKSMLSKWEHGLINPSFQNVVPVAEFLGVSLDYLLGIEKEKDDAGSIAGKVARSPELQEIVRQYLSLPDVERQTVATLIKSLCKQLPDERKDAGQ